jgi:hypothetical protein
LAWLELLESREPLEIEILDCWKKPAVLRQSNNFGLANDILE